ncbi:uncharacterized protein LACBIDRAFT_311329 [Laccaria bicolor S238N-H82]|uniref:Predicted protein n=1 Tax=Laccaria bicolor (strain S238N-H82 / ATCC MYA-4686) TaxID=486041 RepID=B0CZR2_LACBS|nr:uncharacterized protein LACBIDRAFT_311329 [Laccaria bicolor S238N-H82]EDR12196.1 predicted protein [Laccaria bicolor S238N-H82]|eukprot:XP_001876460.1 predicted protein [Laccaria bicolor S238N-H82]
MIVRNKKFKIHDYRTPRSNLERRYPIKSIESESLPFCSFLAFLPVGLSKAKRCRHRCNSHNPSLAPFQSLDFFAQKNFGYKCHILRPTMGSNIT